MNTEKADLSAAKRELLRRRLAGTTGGGGGIPRRGSGPECMSPVQHAMWVTNQFLETNALYAVPRILHVRGALDVPALRSALDALAGRHEVLRTTFPEPGADQTVSGQGEGERRAAVGRTGADSPVPLAVTAAGSMAEALDLAAVEIATPFDLTAGPVMRALLIGLGDADHLLVLTAHHMVTDGWSCALMLRELDELYAAHVADRPSTLAPLPIHYADYAAWQSGRLAAGLQAEQLDYWRTALADTPGVLELPTDRPRPGVESHRGHTVEIELGAELSARVRGLAGERRVTVYTVLLTALATVLRHVSGQDRFAIGSVLSGRTAAETEPLLGLFANAVALPMDLSGQPAFTAQLARAHQAVLGAFDHADVTFDQVVAAVKATRSAARNPVYQVLYQCFEERERVCELPGLRATTVELPDPTAKVDLTCTAVNRPDGIGVALNYATDLFGEDTVRRFGRYLVTVLDQATAQPDEPVTAAMMMGAEEIRLLTQEWATAEPPARDPGWDEQTVVSLIRRQAAATPGAPAVIDEHTMLTYAEFDRLTDRIARALRARGVQNGDVVGIALPRGASMVASAVGILKAAGSYLSLDPSFPAARISLLLEDAAARIVIGDTVSFDDLAEGDADAPAELPEVRPTDLAYVVYTSGSTGRPKGIDTPHGAIVNLLLGARDVIATGAGDRWLMLSSLGFDGSTQELFLPLISGAAVVVASDEARLDGARLCALMREHGVTHAQATPAGWQLLLAGGFDGRLKYAVNTAEALPTALADQLRAHSDELVNGYGPTEITVHATHAHLGAGTEANDIGRPIPGDTVYVLDADLNPVPRGALGELFVGGPGVARGYRGRPGLTAAKFVPDPFGPAGSRLYRTGDLVRFAADGSLRIHGRIDAMVKIRSHSVEPAEIEAALLAHPAVARAAVIAVEGPAGRRLVGYVTPEPPAAADPAELRNHLTGLLPGYLVPSRIVVLDEMPLTASRKIDRGALPQVSDLVAEEGPAGEAPRTPAEQELARIWCAVLDLPGVGVQDNFFDIGGDSVAAIHVAAAAREAGLLVTPRQVLTQQTLADLAAGAAPVEAAEPVLDSVFDPSVLAGAGIDPGGVEDAYPLSPMQTGMLFHTLFHPDADDYVVQFAYDLDGELDPGCWRRALELVVRRHPALRTTFAWDGLPEPLQVVWREAPVEVTELDWSAEPEPASRERLAGHLAAARARGVDLESTPPRRFDLIRLADRRHLFVWHGHHILLDGWSVRAVLDEVRAVHEALLTTGAPPRLPAPVPFRRHIDWLRAHDPAVADEYWDGVLGDVTDPTPLTVLPAPAPPPGAEPEQVAVEFPADFTDALRAFARGRRITVGALVHAAWGLVLSRFGGGSDVVFGSTTSGRSGGPAGVEQAVGLLINTLPVRLRIPGRTPIGQWLDDVHGQLVALRDFEHCALVDVQRHSRIPSGRRLFDTILMYESRLRPDEPLATGLRAASRQTWEATGYPLVLNVALADRLRLRLDHDPAHVGAAGARQLVEHFELALRAFVTEPDRVAAELAPLPAAEWQATVEDYNATGRSFPAGHCLHQLFEDQADRTPDGVAVRFGAETVTYRELDERANRVAHELRAAGVGRESLVAICVRRGVDMTVAVLGVLKSGAAYVPLDPEYPADRIEFMLADTAAPVVVTQTALLGVLPEFGGTVVCLDRAVDAERIASRAGERPTSIASPENLSYVIYTSGSTGRPKGTLIRHRGIVNYIWWMATDFPLAEGDKVLQLAGLSFDISVYEMFWAWTCGATVVLGRPDGYKDPQYIVDVMAGEQITAAHLVPSMLRAMLPLVGEPLPLRWLFASAEAMTLDLVAEWHRRCPETPLMNLYGATEVSVDSTAWRCDADSPVISVGRPILNTRMYLLDAGGAPVPVGVPGEAYLGGASVGRGYHGRPGLTARRFVPDPFGPPGARLYRTGDLLRRLPDGEVEFLGRLDHQVKIRGFRVEMGEVEAALLAHPRLAHAAVVADHDAAGPTRLIAYVVADGEAAPTVSELRAHLASRVPDYMVPQVFMTLPALPLNPNGKVDRKALPAPEGARPDLVVAFAAPRTDVEKALAEVWCQVLGVREVGVHDNFFDLGGDSILSIKVMVAARQRGVALTPRRMFANPTIAELAASVEGAGAVAAVAVHAEQGPVVGPLPLTPIQRWFTELEWPVDHYNQAVRLAWSGPADEAALRNALAALVGHHDALRLRLVGSQASVAEPGEGDPLDVADVLDVLDVREKSGREADALIEAAADDLHASLSVADGPMLRALLVRIGAGRPDEVVITAHHLVVDTVSWGILLDDLATGYQQACDDQPITLPAKTTSFQHWAQRLAEHAGSAEFAAEAGFWRLPRGEAVPFPVDADGVNSQGSLGELRVRLDAEHTEALLRSAHTAYRTQINDLLVTALVLTLGEHCGVADVHVDLEGHGRQPLFEDVDLTRTVGWFTSVHPLRIRLSDPGDLRHSILTVKEHLHGTPGHGIGYGIARYLGAEVSPRSGWTGLGPAPVSFNYLGQHHSVAEAGLFTRLGSVPGAERAAAGIRPHLLEVDAAVIDGVFQVVWGYSRNLYRCETVQALAEAFLRNLSLLVEHCRKAALDAAPTPARAFLDRLSPGVPAVGLRLRRHGVPGASLALVADGEVVEAWGEGVADAVSGVPVRPDTVFQAGSVSKHVTAVAVARLVDEGVVDLDEDIDAYLRSWRLPRGDSKRRPVTLRMLLSHTAGLSLDEFGGAGARRADRPVPSLLDVLEGRAPAETAPIRQIGAPGEYRYSGTNFVVVEQVLQDAAGEPFPELMRDLLFGPLGLRDSGYGPAFVAARDRDREGRVAVGHDVSGAPIPGRWRLYPAATGGLWTTAADLAKIAAEVQRAQAGAGPVLLDQWAAQTLLSESSAAAYGLGTVVRTAADGVRWFGHTGATEGYRCYTAVGLEPGAGIVLMSNSDAGSELAIDLLLETGAGFHAWAEQTLDDRRGEVAAGYGTG
ncbi:amino acid adenylation domain-containing protein [Catenulispora subtropica]|uniref:Carrier domain-containing protein n=1 Tax=Catenulispora subtropica TaxID=450798 RepID=A0ABN2TAC5_9ACTN